MSLLSKAMTECMMLDTTTAEADGYGGVATARGQGETFLAAIVLDSSMQARVAAAQGVTSIYTITTRRDKVLKYHDVFRRISDGQVFRVTSDGTDRKTPGSAGLNMRQVSAEKWSVPNG